VSKEKRSAEEDAATQIQLVRPQALEVKQSKNSDIGI
jgi:hypothetical protein